MPTTIAVTNQKGGVGKTTVTVNVAGALTERGHEVLDVETADRYPTTLLF